MAGSIMWWRETRNTAKNAQNARKRAIFVFFFLGGKPPSLKSEKIQRSRTLIVALRVEGKKSSSRVVPSNAAGKYYVQPPSYSYQVTTRLLPHVSVQANCWIMDQCLTLGLWVTCLLTPSCALVTLH